MYKYLTTISKDDLIVKACVLRRRIKARTVFANGIIVMTRDATAIHCDQFRKQL